MKFFNIRKSRNLSNLRKLQLANYLHYEDIDFCKNIVDLYPGIVGFEFSIFKKADILGCLSVLSNLQLSDCEIHASINGLDERICEFISKQCSLQSLSIHYSGMRSKTIMKLYGILKDLTCLDLSATTGVGVFTALPELSKLKALNLSYTDVNDEGPKNIATKASHLKKLTLIGCCRLSDIGIEYIADGCHYLEHLVIYIGECGGVRLFSSTLDSLGKGCQKLKHLAVKECIGLNDSGVTALVQNCHDLEYLELQSKNISTPSCNIPFL